MGQSPGRHCAEVTESCDGVPAGSASRLRQQAPPAGYARADTPPRPRDPRVPPPPGRGPTKPWAGSCRALF